MPYSYLVDYNAARDRALAERDIELTDFLELPKEERDVMFGNDRDATAAVWSLTFMQRTLNKLRQLEEKHACRTGHMVATPKCNCADHSMPS